MHSNSKIVFVMLFSFAFTEALYPGCYYKQGFSWKCGPAITSWHLDVWGMKTMNTSTSESKCLRRGSEQKKHCGTNMTWMFVEGTENEPWRPPPPVLKNPPLESGSIRVMSYNTEYSGYNKTDGRVVQFGEHINAIGATIVGLEEAQNIDGGIMKHVCSKYEMVGGAAKEGPSILYDKNVLTLKQHGMLKIPPDEYDPNRKINYAKFEVKSSRIKFFFWNTHLPHRAGESNHWNTHKKIALMWNLKRTELNADLIPQIGTCDCNSHEFWEAKMGGFEGNLDIPKVYEGKGDTGGWDRIDKIFASEDLIASNGMGRGTGSSDHAAITVDFKFKGKDCAESDPTLLF